MPPLAIALSSLHCPGQGTQWHMLQQPGTPYHQDAGIYLSGVSAAQPHSTAAFCMPVLLLLVCSPEYEV